MYIQTEMPQVCYSTFYTCWEFFYSLFFVEQYYSDCFDSYWKFNEILAIFFNEILAIFFNEILGIFFNV